MDVDIRKPITHRFGIERPGQTASFATSTDPMDSDDEDSEAEDEVPTGETTPSHLDGEDETQRRLRIAQAALSEHEREQNVDYGTANGNELDQEERVASMPIAQDPDDYPIYDSEDEDEEEAMEAARKRGGWYYRWKVVQKQVSRAAGSAVTVIKKATPVPKATPMPRSNGGPMNPIPATEAIAKRFRAPPGKRVHVPVRVEPKVYFAAERTFLSWLEFSIILGGIAATLLNFGDSASIYSAWGFVIVACAALLYSVVIYWLRVEMIRSRRASVSRYYDRWGPTLLCLALFAAVAVNFAFKIKEDGWFDRHSRVADAADANGTWVGNEIAREKFEL